MHCQALKTVLGDCCAAVMFFGALFVTKFKFYYETSFVPLHDLFKNLQTDYKTTQSTCTSCTNLAVLSSPVLSNCDGR